MDMLGHRTVNATFEFETHSSKCFERKHGESVHPWMCEWQLRPGGEIPRVYWFIRSLSVPDLHGPNDSLRHQPMICSLRPPLGHHKATQCTFPPHSSTSTAHILVSGRPLKPPTPSTPFRMLVILVRQCVRTRRPCRSQSFEQYHKQKS